jgi:hypothetical protein
MATSTSVSSALTDVPDILKPYLTGPGGVLPTAQSIMGQNYDQMYGNALNQAGLAGSGRVASLSPMQTQIGNTLRNMQVPGQFATGTSYVDQGMGNVRSGTGAVGQGIGAVGQGLAALQGFNDPSKVQSFMSPYIQNVMDVNKAEALRDAQKQLVGANLASARQGSYGGARNALMQSEADRNLQTKMGSIQATGMQNAFEAAQKMQQAQAAGYNQAGQTYGQLGQTYGQLGQTAGSLGSTMGALGTAQLAGQMDITKAQGAYGDLQRAIQQQQLDAQYGDLMARLNQPLTNVETMSNLARGIPLTQTAARQTQTAPPPSFASQLAGTGLTGLSLYNMFGK